MAEEDVIDLSPYLRVLLRRWWLILGLAVVAAGAMGAATLASPVAHEATAMVALPAPDKTPTPTPRVFLEMAASGSVVAGLAGSLPSGQGESALDAAGLRGRLRVNPGPDPSLVRLQVRDSDPRRAAQIASAWSAAFVQAAADTLREVKLASLPLLEEQVGPVGEQVQRAEREHAEARGAAGADMLQEKLELERHALSTLHSTRLRLAGVAREAATMGARLRQVDRGMVANIADDRALLFMEAGLHDASAQVQPPGNPEGVGRTVGAQLAWLEGLSALIEKRSRENDREIAAAESGLFDLLGKLQRAREETAVPELKAEAARQQFRDLQIRLGEVRMDARLASAQVRVIGEPSVEAVPRGTTRNIAVAGVLGLMVGVAAAFGLEFASRRRAARQPHPQGSP